MSAVCEWLTVSAVYAVDDQNRVRLLEMDGVEGFDYINASFVDVSAGAPLY